MYGVSPEKIHQGNGGPPEPPSAPAPPEGWKPSVSRELIEVVFRYRWLIVFTVVTTIVSTALWLFIRHDVYETTAKVLVRFARDSFNPRAETSSNVAKMLPAPRPDLPTETDLIGSYAIISQVVDRLHLDQPGPPKPPPERLVPRIRYELRRFTDWARELGDELQYSLAVKDRLSPREKAIVEVSESLAVETAKDSSVFSIKLRTKFKEGASVILNTLVDIYSEHRMNVEREPEKQRFLDKQLATQGEKLRSEEQALDALKKQAGIYGALPVQIDLANRRVLEAENSEKATATLLASLEAKEAALSTQLKEQRPTIIVSEVDQRNALLDTLNEKHSGLLLERQKLLGKFNEGHAAIKDLDDQIAKVKDLITGTGNSVRQSQTTSVNPNFSEIQKEMLTVRQSIQAARAQQHSQQTNLAELRSDRAKLQDADTQYHRLTRAISIDEESYRFQHRNSNEFKTAEAMTANGITQIAVVDKAVDPIVPKGYRKIYILSGSIVAGFVLAFGLAFVCNGLDGSVSSPSALAETVRRPPLAVVPYSKAVRKGLPPGEDYDQEVTAIASECDSLSRRYGLTTFSFTAPHSGTGASSIAVHVSEVLARTLHKKILHVGLSSDPKVPALTRPLTEGSENGGILILEGGFSASLTAPQVEEQVHSFVRHARYDMVVIDIDAALPPHQQLGAASGSQATVVVAESERTGRTALQALVSKLEASGVRIAGVVLSKHKRRVPRSWA